MARQEHQSETDSNDNDRAARRAANDHDNDHETREREASPRSTAAGESTTSRTSTGTSQTSTSAPKDPQGPPTGNRPTTESQPTVGQPTAPNQPRTGAASGRGAEKPDEKLDPKTGDMLVDPRPTAPPIVQGNAEYVFPPAQPSSEEVLAIEPNLYEDAVDGPDEQISAITYTHWTRPDGGDFIAPLSTAEVYERKGYQRGEDEDIPDLVAYLAERAKSDEQRERDETSRKRIEQHDKDRRELLEQQADRRRELARAR